MNQTDFLDNIVLFIRALRQAGLPVSSEQTMDFARGLTLIDIGQRDQVYYTARSLLVSRYEHLRLFEMLFNRFWDVHEPNNGTFRGQKAPRAPRHKREQRPYFVTYMNQKAGEDEPEIDAMDKTGTFSPDEVLRNKEFADMTPEELQAIKHLIENMRWQESLRRTRRYVHDPAGKQLHLRRVLASAARHGGVPIKLAWRDRKIKQRPLIVLADISGSMEKYSRLVLQFFYSMTHSLRDVECFVFATRLTRITPALRLKNIDQALSEASLQVADWSGGTRIGESLQYFNQHWNRRVVRRGAIVLIVSDGWERGDTTILKKELYYLQLRCHRLIWLNPLLGKSSYQPLVEGMQAALSYIDDFLPIHNWQSLSVLADHLQSLDKHRRIAPRSSAYF